MVQSSNGMGIRRRAVLGTLAAGATASVSGCLRRARSVAGWDSMEQVSLRIKTLPADSDPYALHAARMITSWYQAAGIDAQVVPVSEEELLRQVLLGNDFEIFLARSPTREQDPDILYGLLHSRFADTRGWQNPFGFADLDVDEWLEEQRRATGERRQDIVGDLLESSSRSQPFTVLCSADEIRAARRENYRNWYGASLHSTYGYLALERVSETGSTDDGSESEEATLRIVGTDRRPTENLNPLSVEHRRSGVLTGLLYDPIGYATSDGMSPWLAESWSFSDGDGGPEATVRLRPDRTWHDGEPLTAEDVAFTFAMLSDTTLGSSDDGTEDDETEADTQVPSPRFYGRSELVDEVTVTSDTVAVIQFTDCSPRVATRAFTVPILPKHVWEERTDRVSISGIEISDATEALVTNNIEPVGSGPLRFVQNTPRDSLVLEPFEDHFLADDSDERGIAQIGAPQFDRLELQIVGSDNAAVGVVADADADVTATPVGADTVPQIGRASDLELVVNRSTSPYLLGYNTQIPPLTNPRFRHALARLVDRSFLVSDVFNGYANPAVTLLDGTEWVPEDLRWDGDDPTTPFLGTDGELDIARVREEFRNAGFQYEDGVLVRGT
ncbi:ABC transporter substrate-binding protein [Halobellus captivus]|uniref:ABC transporter substrate-binding protein n=1 Tax=Halobellus captivus TaxID=2592614 RepID=UPI0011A927BE|nr:ABC transporter substrate-binding protein [Halobellus captivus]